MHISIAAETLFHIGGFPVTNSMLMAWIVVIFLSVTVFFVSRNPKKVPGRLQALMELILEKFVDFMQVFTGDRNLVKKYLPIVGTIFFFVLFSNWAGILPGVGTIGFYEKHVEETVKEVVDIEGVEGNPASPSEATETVSHSADTAEHENALLVPFFRSGFADLNMTLALALIVVISTHIIGFVSIGVSHHIGKFLQNPFKKPIGAFIGFLELIGEVSRVVSFSFRLFGNLFAGEVLLMIISSLVPYFIPIPFLGLEVFVGFVQALIFSTLAMTFIAASTQTHEEH